MVSSKKEQNTRQATGFQRPFNMERGGVFEVRRSESSRPEEPPQSDSFPHFYQWTVRRPSAVILVRSPPLKRRLEEDGGTEPLVCFFSHWSHNPGWWFSSKWIHVREKKPLMVWFSSRSHTEVVSVHLLFCLQVYVDDVTIPLWLSSSCLAILWLRKIKYWS